MDAWPSLVAPAWIPVDHALVSSDIEVVKRFTGPYIGADHFPLILELELPKAVEPVVGAD